LHRPKLVLLTASIGLLFTIPAPSEPHWVTRQSFIMGTTLDISVRTEDRARGFAAIESGLNVVRRMDDLLNDWRNDSELSRLNSAPPGQPLRLSRPLMDLLDEVSIWTRETHGAFDPAIGVLIDAWDTRGQGRRPTPATLAAAIARVGLLRYQLDADDRLVTPPLKGSWIDAGGFGKGAALRAARNALVQALVPAGVLDFGGQIVVFGDTTWTLGVAHPAHRQLPVAQLTIHDASSSTTSQSEHYIEVNGERVGHVLDPRSGIPLAAWGSVTVVHPDPMVADILSTALFVMGPDSGLAWAEKHHIAALFLIADSPKLFARWTPPMESILTVSAFQSTGD
jgi:thiamine biosynthesis lipoprotein